MGFFRELPNVAYQTPLNNRISSNEYILAKNLFRSAKTLDWLRNNITVFNKFVIEDNDRPDIIAEKLYGDPELDYVVIIIAEITNIKEQWPLTNQQLYEYAENKWGLTGLNALHHYETLEVKDDKGRTVLPAGLNVDSEFKIDGPDTKLNGGTWSVVRDNGSITSVDKVELDVSDIGIGVSNYIYEVKLNEEKRKIKVLKEGYLQQFLNDFRRVMRYDRNTQYINPKLIGTENTRIIE
tara:strand:+ start:749 stop:1462 length:714 start_codon:yes stop_codon:yes gene_type:complete